MRAAGIVGDDDVARLHVAMHQAARMRAVERVADRPEDLERQREAQCAVAPQQHPEVGAVDVLHREEQGAIRRLPGLVELEHVRMIEGFRVLHLPLEAGGEGQVVGDQPPGEHLDRADASLRAAGEVDGAHAAFAEHGLEPVPADLGAQLGSASPARRRHPSTRSQASPDRSRAISAS